MDNIQLLFDDIVKHVSTRVKKGEKWTVERFINHVRFENEMFGCIVASFDAFGVVRYGLHYSDKSFEVPVSPDQVFTELDLAIDALIAVQDCERRVHVAYGDYTDKLEQGYLAGILICSIALITFGLLSRD